MGYQGRPDPALVPIPPLQLSVVDLQPGGKGLGIGGGRGEAEIPREPVDRRGFAPRHEHGTPVLAGHGKDPAAGHLGLEPVPQGRAQGMLGTGAREGGGPHHGGGQILHAVDRLPRGAVPPLVFGDAGVAWEASGEDHRMTRPGLREGVIVVGGIEGRPLPHQLAQAPRQVLDPALHQFLGALVHGNHHHQLGTGEVGPGKGQARKDQQEGWFHDPVPQMAGRNQHARDGPAVVHGEPGGASGQGSLKQPLTPAMEESRLQLPAIAPRIEDPCPANLLPMTSTTETPEAT